MERRVEQPRNPDRQRRAQRVVLGGVVVSVSLGVVKLLAGLLGNSSAMIADAVESFTDVVAAVVVWGGLHVSARPASERHPYGYGKAESLAAVIVALLILGAGVAIAVHATRAMLTTHDAPAPWTLLVLLLVMLTKEALFRALRAEARRAGSDALHADAWHHRSDALTSLAAFVGILIAVVGGEGWQIADEIAALFAAGVIVSNALRILRAPVRELLDAHSPDLAIEAQRIAGAVEGVRNVEKVFTRKSGVSHFVDMHVWVDPAMNVQRAHELAHRVKDAVMLAIPDVEDVLIHIEPDSRRDQGVSQDSPVSPS